MSPRDPLAALRPSNPGGQHLLDLQRAKRESFDREIEASHADSARRRALAANTPLGVTLVPPGVRPPRLGEKP